jgi:large subunit ribosomal protein L36
MVEAGQREGKGHTTLRELDTLPTSALLECGTLISINSTTIINHKSPIHQSTTHNMFTAILRRVLPTQAGPSTRACSSSAKCSHLPVTARLPLSTATPLARSMPSARIATPLSRSIFQLSNRISQSKAVSTSLMGQLRGMKVRSSVKKFCDGCSVVRR